MTSEGIDFEALGDFLAAESTWIGDGRTKAKINDIELEVVNIKSLKVIAKPILGIDTDNGFRFEKILITIEMSISSGERKKAERLADLTHKYCLISKAIAGNVEEVVEKKIMEV